MITRVGDAHLGGFGSLDAVAEAKAELITALPADGWAVLAATTRGCAAGRRRTDERSSGSVARWTTTWWPRDVESREGTLELFASTAAAMSVNVWGRHHLAGALAAVAVGRIFGLSDAEIARGLADFSRRRCAARSPRSAAPRSSTTRTTPVPMAMRAALELLRDFDAPGRRIVVCGDMRELGDAAATCTASWAIRSSRSAAPTCSWPAAIMPTTSWPEPARPGMPHSRADRLPRARRIARRIGNDSLQPGDVVLVKGSRAMAMERLVAGAARHASCNYAA